MEFAISKDKTEIAYHPSGRGPPLILIDGALCSRSLGPMPRLASLLSTRFTVYHYDRRGRGDSSDTAPYFVSRELEDLEALIRVAGGSAHLMGVSSGAALALQAAIGGLSIAKLALFEPPFIAEGSKRAARATATAIPAARQITLPGQNHNVAPTVLAPVLTEFFLDDRARAPLVSVA